MWLPGPDGAAAPLHTLTGGQVPAVPAQAVAAARESRAALRVVG
ncbi:hypothetical protein [Streptomyces sp. NPDC051636]